MSTLTKLIVYPVFAVLCLVIFSVVLFPFNSLKERAAREIEEVLGGNYSIVIGNLSPSWLGGVVLKEVEIRPRGREVEPAKLSQARLKFALFPLLSGAVEVAFDLRPQQGRAVGSFSWKKGGMGFDVKMEQLDLSLMRVFVEKLNIPLSGVMSGRVAMELYDQSPLKNSGLISLKIPTLKLGEMDLAGGMVKLPALKLSGDPTSQLEVVIQKGNFELKSFRLLGDLSLDADGKIYGARQSENYRFNLKGNIRLPAELIAKIPILSAIEKQKGPDGSYPFTITGQVSKPNIRIGDFKLPI